MASDSPDDFNSDSPTALKEIPALEMKIRKTNVVNAAPRSAVLKLIPK
jgi:hypothetical protein